jgi:hypothetical protein
MENPFGCQKTIVKVVYDNDAIYIAALYDDEPTKIMRSQLEMILVPRMLWRFINGFNDGQQDFQFFVNAADGQADCITTDTNGEDYSWDAVWKSKAIITDLAGPSKCEFIQPCASLQKKNKLGT